LITKQRSWEGGKGHKQTPIAGDPERAPADFT
jgi:hypothetical protein